ncbi:MAG: ribonucleoside-diphosphate reductase subunit alpha [Acidobacteriota bacterium]|nr:ribonucleoside-diphosphate reductase subunit alpha [Acidobacteriota bacterium]
MLTTRVVKRTGEIADFDGERIQTAILKAVDATEGDVPPQALDAIVEDIVKEVSSRFIDFYPNVENIQDIVEKHLVVGGHYEIAKAYILYRDERRKVRDQAKKRAIEDARLGKLTVVKRDGRKALFNVKTIEENIQRAARDDLTQLGSGDLVREVINNVYDEIPTTQIEQALVLAAASFIERDPGYSCLAGRLLLQRLYKDVIGRSVLDEELDGVYRESFAKGLKVGIEAGLYDPRLAEFDLALLTASLKPERDLLFQYLGIQTLADRYFVRTRNTSLELPQAFWMRVAMGLAVEETHREERAIQFYDLMSQLYYVPSTPTLFHAGTPRPQLSSCYLTTIADDLEHIFKSLGQNAQLSKWSGGLGNDWSNIRATGAHIKSTNVESQGVVPFLKIANDVTMAINRSGKRRGATCAYLETWHYDIEDFLDLRRNTGDERRRTHDMNTANWIPDLFMKRVMAEEQWTLMSPDEVPDLHQLYGRAFEKRYLEYEAMAERGELELTKKVSAVALWRKMLTMLFETGHPWMTFKDPCNIRSPQDHVGVIHSSNLCTEITLNTSADETAVCNLGSVNLARHVALTETGGEIDYERLAATVETAQRMLDNVININFYPTEESRNSNLRHRPVGLGVMGFQDALYGVGVPFTNPRALELADRIHETISYHAILASSKLARERGSYPSYEGSKWSRGILPFDTLDLLEQERGMPVEVSRESHLDWTPVREHLAQWGMRNSNTMAIAPTATISNISGCFPCIEPIYKNIYVKANISGEFTVVNHYLVNDLKALGLWDPDMLERLKYCDGRVAAIPEIPQELREKYQEAFEIDPLWCLELTAARAKWIDQSQSHNVFVEGTSGKLLSDIYIAAWKYGLKTTYYLRSLAASQIEKSTLDASKYGYTQKREYAAVTAAAAPVAGDTAEAMPAGESPVVAEAEPLLCRIEDPECEACQ